MGRSLLATRDFDTLSIAELAAAQQLSVGSFYGRFRDKEAFFAVLQQQVYQFLHTDLPMGCRLLSGHDAGMPW